jgi:hypothetical protein
MLAYYEEKNTGKGIASLLLGPIIGLAYAVSLPIIAITATVVLISKRALDGVVGMVSFGWRPSEAYLSGKKKKKADKK